MFIPLAKKMNHKKRIKLNSRFVLEVFSWKSIALNVHLIESFVALSFRKFNLLIIIIMMIKGGLP